MWETILEEGKEHNHNYRVVAESTEPVDNYGYNSIYYTKYITIKKCDCGRTIKEEIIKQ